MPPKLALLPSPHEVKFHFTRSTKTFLKNAADT